MVFDIRKLWETSGNSRMQNMSSRTHQNEDPMSKGPGDQRFRTPQNEDPMYRGADVQRVRMLQNEDPMTRGPEC